MDTLRPILFYNALVPETELYDVPEMEAYYTTKEVDAIAEKTVEFDNIFTFTRNFLYSTQPDPIKPLERLTAKKAIYWFEQFLIGNLTHRKLQDLRSYFDSEIKRLENFPATNELLLYSAICEVISRKELSDTTQPPLLFSLQKVVNYAKNLPNARLPTITRLFKKSSFSNFV